MTIFADGSTSTTQLATRTYNQVGAGGAQSSWSGSSLSPGSAIPDGHGGVLATWSELFVDLPSSYMVSHISPNGQSDFHLAALDNMSSLFSSNSWTGQWFSVGPGVSAINLPLAVDAASFWPEVQGNPSQSRFGVPGCPRLVQSTSNTSSPTTSSAQPRADDPVSHTTTETLPSDEVPLTAQISAPTDCPICNLISPSC